MLTPFVYTILNGISFYSRIFMKIDHIFHLNYHKYYCFGSTFAWSSIHLHVFMFIYTMGLVILMLFRCSTWNFVWKTVLMDFGSTGHFEVSDVVGRSGRSYWKIWSESEAVWRSESTVCMGKIVDDSNRRSRKTGPKCQEVRPV